MTRSGTLAALLPYLVYLAIALRCSIVDIRMRAVPTVPLRAGVILLYLSLLAAATAVPEQVPSWRITSAALGGMVLTLAYLLLGGMNRGALGGGDVRFALPTGTVLGFTGWTAVVAGGLAGFILGAFGVLLLSCGRGMRRLFASARGRELRRTRSTASIHLPFVPFMSLGAIAMMIATIWISPDSLAVRAA